MKFSEIKSKTDKKQFNELLEQVTLIFNGANGGGHTVTEWNDEWLSAEGISRVMYVISQQYAVELSLHVIQYFDKPAHATLYLWNDGIRAVSVGEIEDIAPDMNGED